ncbi:hypothetical protein BaRGS_00014977 [Batillaria attramentaria]|uniref:C2H2-type domain-containing protein n=1 Tax=Batillaria attramentaria TaxID=370345 RepID=A0ABD0L3J9_9CAEN
MEQILGFTNRQAVSMSDKNRSISKSSGDDIMCVDVKNEDPAISECFVCRKILSCHTNMRTASDSGQAAVCGKMCFRVLDQTMAFMQGFVLCKLLCDFMYQQSTCRQRAIQARHSSSSSSYSDHSLNEESVLPQPPVAVETGEDMKLKSNKVENLHCASVIPLRHGTGSSRSATSTRTGIKERVHGTRVTSTVTEDTIMPASYEVEEPFMLQDGYKTTATEASVKVGISPETPNNTSHDANNVVDPDSMSQDQLRRVLCGECGMAFKTKKSMKIHVNKNHKKPVMKKKEMKCHICGKLCIGQVGLTLHIGNQHAGEKAVECDICGDKFFNSKALKRHRTLVHNKPHGMCHICGKHFKYAHTLKEHIRAHTGIKGFVCELCGKSFVRLSNLCDHRRRDHPHGKQMKDQDQTGRRRPSRPKLDVFQCRECKKTMENLKEWKAHKEEHKLNRTIICQICGKSFKTESSLYAHKKQHQEKRFQCDICSRLFTLKSQMERHRETHREDRPYKCDFCQKTFKTELVMNRHKVMHIEDRQYKCHICGRGLTCMDNLKKHLRVMHPGSDT